MRASSPPWSATCRWSTSSGALRTSARSASRHGPYGASTCSSVRPRSTSAPSACTARASSDTSRVFPTPGSPAIIATLRSPAAAAFHSLRSSSRASPRPENGSSPSSGASGPGSGTASVATAGVHATSAAPTGSGRPLSSSVPTDRNSCPPRVPESSRTTSLTRICPAAAAPQRRAPSTTGAPNQSSPSWVASPAEMPTRTVSASAAPPRASASTARCIATPAETASDALPNEIMIPSPRFFTTSPPWASTWRSRTSKWRRRTSSKASSPRRVSSSVDPTMSVKQMTTVPAMEPPPWWPPGAAGATAA